MLPPLPTHLLTANPQFAKLHAHLTTNVLNPDGSLRASTESKEAVLLRKELHRRRVCAMQRRILREVLADMMMKDDLDIADEDQSLLAITALYLQHGDHDPRPFRNPDSQVSLLQPDLEAFIEALPELAPHMAKYLMETLQRLTDTATGTTAGAQEKPNSRLPQPQKHRRAVSRTTSQSKTVTAEPPRPDPATLPALIKSQLNSFTTETTITLPLDRTLLTASATDLLSEICQNLETTIQLLERRKYGSISRGLKTHSENLAIVAKATDLKIKLLHADAHSRVYTDEVIEALGAYRVHLADARRRAAERETWLRSRLEGFERCGDGMKEVARRVRGVEKEMVEVRAEVRKLGGKVDDL